MDLIFDSGTASLSIYISKGKTVSSFGKLSQLNILSH